MVDRGKLEFINDDIDFYKHQVEGVRWLARLRSWLLADEMGLGKSLQSLTVAAVDFEMGLADRCLIVALASLKGNWLDEIHEFTTFSATVLEGTPDQRAEQLKDFEEGDTQILIVNYEQLLPHADDFNRINFDIIIYDEAHAIKNPKAKRTAAAHTLRAKRHFLLTGSPMLGHVDDLWSLLRRIDPNTENYYRFVNRYCVFGGYKDKQIVGVKNRDELKERLDRVMLRRTKEDELDLPPKRIIPINVDLSDLQRELYDKVVEEMLLEAPDPTTATPVEIENALTQFLRLKQICGTPSCIKFEDDTVHPDDSAKLDRAMAMAEEVLIENEKHLVVFTQFRGVQEAISNRLWAKNIQTFVMNGDTPARERKPMITQWSNAGPSVLCAMIQVGGVGLTMTKADTAFFLDKTFVPKINEQAQDRLHRIGADKKVPVSIYEFIARGTIEDRIEQILTIKKELFDDVVEADDWKRKLYASLMEEENV